MSVILRIHPLFRNTDPTLLSDPKNYCIQLAEPRYLVPSPSNQVRQEDIASGQRSGGPGYILLRPDEDFILMSEQFELIVESAQAGGMTDFIDVLLPLVIRSIVQVEAEGVVLTPKQILDYQSP